MSATLIKSPLLLITYFNILLSRIVITIISSYRYFIFDPWFHSQEPFTKVSTPVVSSIAKLAASAPPVIE